MTAVTDLPNWSGSLTGEQGLRKKVNTRTLPFANVFSLSKSNTRGWRLAL